MKKRLMVFVLAALVILAVPAMAFAVENGSPKADHESAPATASDGSTVSLGVDVEGIDDLVVQPSDYVVPEAQATLNRSDVIHSTNFTATTSNWGDVVNVTLVYTVDPNYAGLTCYVFVRHHDGTVEQDRLEVGADGKVTYKMNKLSNITFVLTQEKFASDKATTAVADKSASSPKTGGIIL